LKVVWQWVDCLLFIRDVWGDCFHSWMHDIKDGKRPGLFEYV
jgi:hypothetical protein